MVYDKEKGYYRNLDPDGLDLVLTFIPVGFVLFIFDWPYENWDKKKEKKEKSYNRFFKIK